MRAGVALVATTAVVLGAGIVGAAPASAATAVDVNYSELDFDYTAGQFTNLVGNGKANGDKVLFKSVGVLDDEHGVATTIDAVVTTQLSSANVKNYEAGTNAGGAASNFQVDMGVDAAYGYGAYTFDFYRAGTYGTGSEDKLTLLNVQMTGIDIDYNQFNTFTGIQGYTVTTNTNLVAQDPSTHAPLSIPVSFPASILFQGPTSNDSTIPQDQVVVTYGSLPSVTVQFGSKVTGQTNYFGVAFKALSFSGSPVSNYGASYTLGFDLNQGTGTTPASQSGQLGQILTLPAAGTIARTGYQLSGWNSKADGTGAHYALGGSFTMPKDGQTLYAEWTTSTYTLAYNANSGTGAPSSQAAAHGTSVAVSATVPVRSGYTFTGWNTGSNGSGTGYAAGASIVMTGNVTLYAQWAITQYTLNYNAAGGTGAPADVTGPNGTVVTVSAIKPTRAHYTFAGWNTLANGTGSTVAAGSTVTLTSNVTLYAQWAPITFALAYNANGGSGAPATQTGNSGSDVTVSSTVPTRTGYSFDGWNTAADGSGADYAGTDALTLAADTTLFAQWTANSYTVTYAANGGTGAPDAQNVTYGTTPALSGSTPSYVGHVFTGWNTAANGSGTGYAPGGTFVVGTSDVTLYAQWVLAEYILSYNANGGTGEPSEQKTTYGTAVTVTDAEPTRTGYTFAGWADGSGHTFAADDEIELTEDLTLFAQWTAISYAVSYDANGGTDAPPSQHGNYASTITLSSSVPSRDGYTFTGWNTAVGGSGTDYVAGGALTLGAADVTLHAQWTAIDYALVYDANGGTGEPDGATVHVGDAITVATTTPTRANYTFTGWNTEADGSGTAYAPNASLTVSASNLTLWAQWVVTPVSGSGGAGGSTGGSTSSEPTNAPSAPGTSEDVSPTPLPTPPADPEDVRTVARQGQSVTVDPLAQQAPPTGQTWDLGSLRLVDPANGTQVTTLNTRQGTWSVAPNGAITFAPKAGFAGTAVAAYQVASSGGEGFGAQVEVIVSKQKVRHARTTVYFESGSPVLTTTAKRTLDQLVTRMKRKARTVLFGETVGFVQPTSYAGNDMSLSTARAQNIRSYLIRHGVRPVSSFEGLGKAQQLGWKARRATAAITYIPR